MSLPNHSEKSVYLDREEHVHKGELGAKRVVMYTYDSGTDTLQPYSSSGGGGGSSYSSQTDEYQLNDYTDGTAPNYYGYENGSGAWYIKKIDDSTSPVLVRYAKGASGYAAAWTGRAGQTYDIYGTVF